jgi:uncharacterized protein
MVVVGGHQGLLEQQRGRGGVSLTVIVAGALQVMRRTVSAAGSEGLTDRCSAVAPSVEFRRPVTVAGAQTETSVLGSLAAIVRGVDRQGAHHLADGLAARRSPSEGYGVFATRPLPVGSLLCVWGGRVVSTTRMLALPEDRRRYAVQIDDDRYLVTPVRGLGAADLINHSCDPTAVLVGANTLVARRDLAVGDEVTYDYATSDANPHLGFACRCGAVICRGVVTGDDWTDPALQARYGDAFSPYLLSRIRSARASVGGPG